jgi:hypothetical protein
MSTCRCVDITLFGDECRCDAPAGSDGLCDRCRTSVRCVSRRRVAERQSPQATAVDK